MGANRFDISIIKANVDKQMAEMGKIGLCMKRFQADVVMDETRFENLHIDDIISIKGRRVRIVRVGKECFTGCELHDNNVYCPLKDSCAFGKWEE